MWFEEMSEVYEMFRTSFPYSIMFFVPILIIISPVSPVAGAHEFSVFRMQQFDLHGSSYGSKNSVVNVEARPIDAKVVTRRCVVAKFKDFTIERYKDIASQNAGGILLLLPQEFYALSEKEKQVKLRCPELKDFYLPCYWSYMFREEHYFQKIIGNGSYEQHFLDVEQSLLQQEDVSLPLYFAVESPDLMEIFEDINRSVHSDEASSGTEALFGAASANGFQLVTNGAQAKAMADFQITNIQGQLSGAGIEEQLPTIAIVAHYDAFGMAPALAKGGDSNASGVAALLELARLFSKLYTNSRTHAKFNLLFLLSGAGKFNYQGTKRWIEDQLESTDSSLLSDATYVLCLDGLGKEGDLNLHVSKPPKEGSAGNILLQNMKLAIGQFFPSTNLNLVHKKINLADDYLAWEHERFSIRRILAFTLSHFHDPKDMQRKTVLDNRSNIDSAAVTKSVKILAETLARHIFNLSATGTFEIFTEGLKVEEESIESWLNMLTSFPRSAQLLKKDSAVVSSLEQAMSRYLKEVSLHSFKADKRDPDFVFYDVDQTTMSAYNVKPAVFDLFLALAISAYLGVTFLFVQNFGTVYLLLKKIGSPVKAKAH